jgi:glycosyltransferase involved in cell wall biosynthesis
VGVARPELLYLSPVIPALTGNGLAMRAGMVLEALSAHYNVSLLVVTLYLPFDGHVPKYFARLCRRAAVINTEAPRRWRRRDILVSYTKRHYDVVYVFRLAMAGFAKSFAASARHLDLDDIESATHLRLALLARGNGETALAEREAAAVELARIAEQKACAQFDRIYVCSPQDREQFSRACARGEIAVLPNGVRVPEPIPDPPGEPFSFMFVGTLGYYPNADAVRWLCSEIAPRLRERARRTWEIRIVGANPKADLVRTVAGAGLVMVSDAPDMRPCYERASAVLVPVRAGGGTRIKILEAWSYRRPVVTTSIGVEGIRATAGEHVLVADSADDFAAECLRLMDDPECGRRLTASAHQRLLENYTLDAIKRTIGATAAGPGR